MEPRGIDHVELLLQCLVYGRPMIQTGGLRHITLAVGFIERAGLAVQAVLVEVLADVLRDGLYLGSSQKTYMNTPCLPSPQFMTV